METVERNDRTETYMQRSRAFQVLLSLDFRFTMLIKLSWGIAKKLGKVVGGESLWHRTITNTMIG
jgi:hypothetical protein